MQTRGLRYFAIRIIRRMGRIVPDTKRCNEFYLKMYYKMRTGKSLNMKNPQDFNEKIQWLKVHDRKPEYTKMVDKYEAKKYVSQIIGEEYIIPTLGVWERFEDIDFSKLPQRFVLKCTHDSGSLVICRDKVSLDIDVVEKKLNHALRSNYYWASREWPYKNVKPRIIAERFIEEADDNLYDYKVYCFNGQPLFIQVIGDRDIEKHTAHEAFYDVRWKKTGITLTYDSFEVDVEKPAKLPELLEVARKLSAECTYARIDMYIINEQLLFGEITFSPGNGCDSWKPAETDREFGKLLELNTK